MTQIRSMTQAFTLSFVGVFLILFGGAFSAQGQQNLFNVPSSDITQKGEWFFQEQLNLNSTGVSNTTFDYGLGNNWEVGVNLLGLDLYHHTGEVIDPMPLINLQKRFDINESWGVGIGTQLGALTPIHHDETRFSTFNYVNNQFRLGHWGKVFGGAYFANDTYSGSKNQVNFMAGIEIPIWENKLHFQADYINGQAPMSVSVIGFVIFLPHRWNISVGAQVPAINSHNECGFVLELTRL
ncbi:MAG: hypothetical protein NTY84_00060 [Verrucomicrobia bacterium]|jgi:hypothetical protein|nr:hypothetical protein [Verrucomicrobiota bacterium]